MARPYLGLSADEHRRASGLLQRTYAALKGVRSMIQRRCPATHPVQQNCRDAANDVQALRVELENAARAEHPAEKLVYLTNDSQISPDALANALAECGEDIHFD